MGLRGLRKDKFTAKALETKGYDVEKILSLTDEEVEKLPLSTKLIECIKEFRARGGKTPEQIANEIADLMIKDDESNIEFVSDYSEQSIEQNLVLEQITETKKQEETEEENVVEIVHKVASPEDIEVIKTALQMKEFRSFASYMKLLKAQVPATIFESVESVTVSELIDARIAEVKAAAK